MIDVLRASLEECLHEMPVIVLLFNFRIECIFVDFRNILVLYFLPGVFPRELKNYCRLNAHECSQCVCDLFELLEVESHVFHLNEQRYFSDIHFFLRFHENLRIVRSPSYEHIVQ